MKKISLFLLIVSHCVISSADAAVRVVTSTSDLAWAVREIGGEHVEVRSFLKGTENPHFVDAVPEFIRLASEAQLAVLVGLDLEVGWMPKVLSRSGNAAVQPGGKGYCETGKNLKVLEKPVGALDRSMGDVHPSGNPHFWLSPTSFIAALDPIVQSLSAIDPSHASVFASAKEKLRANLERIREKNAARLAPFLSKEGKPTVMEYHKEFAYFLATYGIGSLGSIEEKPGVTPSAGRLAEVAVAAKAAGIRAVLAGDTAPKKTLERFREMSGIPVVTVPMSLQPSKGIENYEQFQEAIVGALLKVLTEKQAG